MKSPFNSSNTDNNKEYNNPNSIYDKNLNKLDEERLRCLAELLLGRCQIKGEVHKKIRLNRGNEAADLIRIGELDILLISDEMINIELENGMCKLADLVPRAKYYSAIAISRCGLKTGEDFNLLKPIISMFIVTKKFSEDRKSSIIILPEIISAKYLDTKELLIFVSIADIENLAEDKNYKRFIKAIGVENEEFLGYFKKTIKLLQGKTTEADDKELEDSEYNIFVDKFTKLKEGVTGMNIIKKARIESELVGQVRLLINKFNMTVKEIKDTLDEYNDEDIEVVYNLIISNSNKINN